MPKLPKPGQVARTGIVGPIHGGAWLCTHAVVCRLWAVDGEHDFPIGQVASSAGFGAFVGGHSTQRFLAGMAMEEG